GGNRPLILGGVPIPADVAVSAHSDGDVLLHALIDAILGCLARGDIGTLFPDSDPHYAGIESGVLLSEVLRLAFRDGLAIAHADLTVVAQVPKITPYRERIAANVARLLSLPLSCVNVKATTEEKLGFTGQKKGIKAYAVVTGVMRHTA
ncbi:MAG: 2-C-methyl-D-erythritol 2,4-cyclodiphosphate synthase, partial [Deltaproteobacteria bacterium]|nr:2-C-methyl-D-erythritol 2,4-cyclodiphosphate synthase [Deltaproteobacteria bacterium]